LGDSPFCKEIQTTLPGYLSFKAEVEFAPISADCENAEKQLGIMPYASTVMIFKGHLAKRSNEIDRLAAEEIVGQTLSYRLVVKCMNMDPTFPP
jgi:hypothetical protein